MAVFAYLGGAWRKAKIVWIYWDGAWRKGTVVYRDHNVSVVWARLGINTPIGTYDTEAGTITLSYETAPQVGRYGVTIEFWLDDALQESHLVEEYPSGIVLGSVPGGWSVLTVKLRDANGDVIDTEVATVT